MKNLIVKKDIKKTLNQSPIFSNQFTGFSLYDIEKAVFVSGHNETKKFTPASNVKILTMYASLRSFDFTIPGILYQKTVDSLWVQPIGDPTFLDRRFPSQPTYQFLKNQSQAISIVWPLQDIAPFGSGWAWDDYRYDFQPPRNWWPIYNNMISVSNESGISVSPSFFTDYVEILEDEEFGEHLDRDSRYNLFTLTTGDAEPFEGSIPFDWTRDLLVNLLSDTLQKPVAFSKKALINPDTLFSQPLDHVLAVMMKASDNHLAEQLLIMAAWKNGYSSVQPFIASVKSRWLEGLNEFVWVDGSGLSRYNLIAPIDQVRLLKKASDEFGIARLTNILAVGGVSGTLKNWYAGDEPYIFAKSGTLSNNHNLSGFLKTRSGKWLIFSFMNNHYTVSNDDVRAEMQTLLEGIRDSY